MAVNVPFFAVAARLDEALAALRARHRSAVVADDGTRRWLIYAGDLAAAHARGKVRIADLPATAMLPIAEPFGDPARQKLSLLDTAGNTAAVLSYRPHVNQSLTKTGAYRCNGPNTHFFPLPEVDLGQNCPYCTTSNPTVPTIEPY